MASIGRLLLALIIVKNPSFHLVYSHKVYKIYRFTPYCPSDWWFNLKWYESILRDFFAVNFPPKNRHLRKHNSTANGRSFAVGLLLRRCRFFRGNCCVKESRNLYSDTVRKNQPSDGQYGVNLNILKTLPRATIIC